MQVYGIESMRVIVMKDRSRQDFWKGIRYQIPLCCIMWFIYVHSIKPYKEREEYQEKMSNLTKNSGIILCPYCIEVCMLNTNESPYKRYPQEYLEWKTYGEWKFFGN